MYLKEGMSEGDASYNARAAFHEGLFGLKQGAMHAALGALTFGAGRKVVTGVFGKGLEKRLAEYALTGSALGATAAAGDIYSSISQVPFVIIPTSAFNTYKSVLTWGTQKDTYVGAERVTQSDTGVTYALPFFHADGFNFVSVPDKYFEVRKIPASTGPDCWVALIAPASALQVFLNPVKPSNWLNYGDMSVFGNQDVLNTMLKSEFLEPDLYNMLAANDREDQFLRTYMNRYGGAGNLDWQVMNAISTYIRPLPPGGDPNAMAVTIQSRLDIAVLRMQPQYIQQWAIPKVLV